MRTEDVAYVGVFGDRITNPERIADFRNGLLHAWKLGVPRPNDLDPDGLPRPDLGAMFAPFYVVVGFKPRSGVGPDEARILFYPDLYEGTYPYSEMPGGAISPEFQDALRAAGFPPGGPGLPFWYKIERRLLGL